MKNGKGSKKKIIWLIVGGVLAIGIGIGVWQAVANPPGQQIANSSFATREDDPYGQQRAFKDGATGELTFAMAETSVVSPDKVFANDPEITKITLHNGITDVEEGSFLNDTALTEVTLSLNLFRKLLTKEALDAINSTLYTANATEFMQQLVNSAVLITYFDTNKELFEILSKFFGSKEMGFRIHEASHLRFIKQATQAT